MMDKATEAQMAEDDALDARIAADMAEDRQTRERQGGRMMDKSRTSAELREAFYELAMGGSSPDPETLEALIRLYPNHSVELTDFAISLALDPWPDDDGGNLFVDAARAEEGISAASVACRQCLPERCLQTAPEPGHGRHSGGGFRLQIDKSKWTPEDHSRDQMMAYIIERRERGSC